jgi:phosphatidylglycerophosphatase C
MQGHPPSTPSTPPGTDLRSCVERGHPPPWAALYSDSNSDLPLFAAAPPLGRRPETRSWR